MIKGLKLYNKYVFPIFIFSGVLHIAANSFAFPDMIRHGYLSCTSCHVSPSGGGLLNSYGKSLSTELLSTWGKKPKEDKSASAVPQGESDRWLIGGDLRSIQIYTEDNAKIESEYIPMQADVEAAIVDVGNFSFVGSVGLQRKLSSDDTLNKVFSRRHYVLWKNDEGMSLRAGRFYHAFGLGMPDHIISTRVAVSNDDSDETYNIEGGWYGESFGGLLTIITPSELDYSKQKESGVSAKFEYVPFDKSKIGMSLYSGKRDERNQSKAGVHGVARFSEKLFALAELDTMTSTLNNIDTKTLGGFSRLAYEVYQGVIPYLQVETLSSSSNASGSSDSYARSYGIGALWYPVRMVELNAYVSAINQKISNTSGDQISNSTLSWLLLHFYY